MAALKEAIVSRKVVISQITEICELAKQAELNENMRVLFRIKYSCLESLYCNFKELHLKVLLSSKDNEFETQDAIRKELEENYFESRVVYESLFPPVLEAPILMPTISVETDSTPSANLPKLQLRKFNGETHEWQSFKSLYDSLVHNKKKLSDIDKFQYLLLSLEGEPLTLVQSIPLDPEHYEIAYKALLTRYSNKRLLANSHWHILKNYTPLTSENLKDIRALVDTFSENIAILKKLGFDVAAWDFILVDLLADKLPPATRRRFELQGDASEIPTFADLTDFVLKQCVALQTLASSKVSGAAKSKVSSTVTASNKYRVVQQPRADVDFRAKSLLVQTESTSSAQNSAGSSQAKCFMCKKDHSIHRCSQYLSMTPRERHVVVKRAHLCFNCLREAHGVGTCPSKVSCLNCGKRHHSTLHFTEDTPSNPSETSTALSTVTSSDVVHVGTSVLHSHVGQTVLLSTVLFEILDVKGQPQIVRGLVDPGSMASFMTESCARRLKLPRDRASIPIAGLGQMSTKSSLGVSHCLIRPTGSLQPPLSLDVIILRTVCSEMPSATLSPSNLVHFKPFKLADPTWHQPGPVDILLGADIYSSIVLPEIEKCDYSSLIGIHTIFGVILVGRASYSKLPQSVQTFFASVDTPCLDNTLKSFWKIEEVPEKASTSWDEQQAENSFIQTHFRLPDGRFGVFLPFKAAEPTFRDSRILADRRLFSLERKLDSNPLLRREYVNFMKDYLASGHMTLLEVPPEESNSYVIPHHCVFKIENNQPKIRVVFDASAKDANGVSLNDFLLIGPKLQRDIASILLRFRVHSVVFICDVKQMYRQILVATEHQRFQLIRWRFSSSDPVQTYQLNTVTYGVSAAPFLAIRTLLQLAKEGGSDFPLASQAIENDLYVDDLVCGADSLETALELQRQVRELFGSGCFELRKWSSNHPSLLENLPETHCLKQSLSFDHEDDSFTKVLGLQWQPSLDSFTFAVNPRDSNCSKRSILSEIARIYDPLGFLCPVTFFAKRLIQVLWTLGVGWDELPPLEIVSKWQQYQAQLSGIASLQIPRLVVADLTSVVCQLHAFCDASELGYSCVAYLRCVYPSGNVSVSFLCAKSKVAPLRTLSIPRLELCAAVLLSSLVVWIKTTFLHVLKIESIFAWSDSTITLSWIRSSPHRWKTFVSNRVSLIQDRLAPECWYHIRSSENPADCASRGLLPEEFVAFPSWWAGPSWLRLPSEEWPLQKFDENLVCPLANSEQKKTVLVAQIEPHVIESLFLRFSSLRTIQGIVAYCLRFYYNCRNPEKRSGALSRLEFHQALLCIVKLIQKRSFAKEIMALRKKQNLPKTFLKLSPFVDETGILRVGGRISHANLPFESKHPALLPSSHVLSELLIWQIHLQNLHSGLNTTLYLLQQNFWILGCRRLIRRCIAKCYRCFRVKPPSLLCPMGDLPSVRVSQAKPFSRVGVDFGGPFYIVPRHTRGAKTSKAYLCLFVCLSVKAVHLEIVSDLTTEAFLAALRRFVARRGRCSHIYSDCGTNFTGAASELEESLKLAAESEAITWHFNPPSAPHFGGIWESGIKSVKTHLYRVIGSQILTFEELYTLVTQVEALLNSRPLCALSSDPNDLGSLTPGHFLTLEPLTAPPDPDLSHLNLARLSRWQLIQQLQQSFWKTWSNEYLHQLYQRGKWYKSREFQNLDIGTLVLIRSESTPPLAWRLGRIVQLHPGNDGICRVATVKTTQGTLQRPCVKLCPLPSQ